MKKRILFFIFLITAGALSYHSGYYFYRASNPKTELIEPMNLQQAVYEEEGKAAQEYYYVIIEQKMLKIYKMPEASVYDAVTVSSLHIQEEELPGLYRGMRFETLTEVFEFLENVMS